MKKKLVLVLTAAIMAGSFSNTVEAANSIEKTYSGSFSKSWERYATGNANRAQLTYGYNTSYINEDYAWAKHSTKSHYAALRNGKGLHTGNGKSAGKVSKIEVTHSGSTVKYYCYW